MTADLIFSWLVYAALPIAVSYTVIYGLFAPWWRTDIGQALLTKAVGLSILLAVSALYQFFGPDYFGRDLFRVTGMALVTVGLGRALYSLVRTLWFPYRK